MLEKFIWDAKCLGQFEGHYNATAKVMTFQTVH